MFYIVLLPFYLSSVSRVPLKLPLSFSRWNTLNAFPGGGVFNPGSSRGITCHLHPPAAWAGRGKGVGVKDEALVLLKVTFPYGWVPFWGMFFGFSSR